MCESGPDKQYGYLSTDKNYKNFILTLKFKQEANGNSGVFFRSGIEGVKISGWQVEVAPKNHFTAGIYESYGREWLIKPKPEDEKILKEGKWNTLKIKVTISAQSNLSFAPVSKNDSLFNTDQFQEYLNAKLVDFPKINPAIKRAIPVKTEFVVPICLH